MLQGDYTVAQVSRPGAWAICKLCWPGGGMHSYTAMKVFPSTCTTSYIEYLQAALLTRPAAWGKLSG